eukprot:3079528-Heterocapsa_arctica.AAC.1
MITCTNGANQDCLGYLMYEDMGNTPYAMALEFLENKLRAPELTAEIVAQQTVEGDQPVTCREFHIAINMLKDTINTLKDTNNHIVQENLEEARRTRNM